MDNGSYNFITYAILTTFILNTTLPRTLGAFFYIKIEG